MIYDPLLTVAKMNWLIRGIKNPTGATRIIARKAERVRYRQSYKQPYDTPGIDIFEQDWDNLLILDACRADFFRERASLPGETSKVVSRGGATPEWVRANFSNANLYDVVYVTGNGWFEKLRQEINSEVYDHNFISSPHENDEVDVESIIHTGMSFR